jgi:hypothetical protein
VQTTFEPSSNYTFFLFAGIFPNFIPFHSLNSVMASTSIRVVSTTKLGPSDMG